MLGERGTQCKQNVLTINPVCKVQRNVGLIDGSSLTGYWHEQYQAG
jgi:hypothetical protein